MRYGQVLSMMTEDKGIGSSATVTVRFGVYRSVVYEFMDMIIPADGTAAREPIAAILDHSAEDVEWAIPEEDMRIALGMETIEKEGAEQKNPGTTATEDLKPCPFCGSKAKLKGKHFVGKPSRYWIECRECHASMESVDDIEKTITAWNTRASGVCAFAEPTDLTDGCSLLKERTCRYVKDADTGFELCSECGAPAIEDWTAYYCWACGAKVMGQ